MALHRSDLIKAVAEQASLTQAQAKAAVNAVLDTVTGELAQGNDASLKGFGTFAVRQRAERTLSGPIAQGKVVPAHNAVVFKPGKALKEAVK